MKNFAKSILNYFAAFNETRFRFGSKLSYEWSNDAFTLDFSVFPDFQKQLLETVVQGKSFRFEVRKGKYIVRLDSDAFKTALLSRLETELSASFLDSTIEQYRLQLHEADPERDPAEIAARAIAEGLREYNLTFRKKALESLTALQDEKIKTLQSEPPMRADRSWTFSETTVSSSPRETHLPSPMQPFCSFAKRHLSAGILGADCAFSESMEPNAGMAPKGMLPSMPR